MYLITIILGTRPEAIKLAPIIKCFNKNATIKTRVVVTGQHKEMVEQVFDSFEIKYNLNLEIMTANQTLTDITQKTLVNLEREFDINKPSLVLVQGDTTTAFASALAAFYRKIPVGHIEAGLRTDSILEPFPEEMNRRLISSISSINFAPTEKAFKNLKSFNASGHIYKTGNTVIDAARLIAKKNKNIDINDANLKNKKIILATIHRRENWGDNLKQIANALSYIVKKNDDSLLILPVHPNPVVKEPIKEILGKQERVFLKDPMNYEDLIAHIKASTLIITDSGGIQEEAPGFSKPVLVLRNNTERMESIESGNAKLVGTDYQNIIDHANSLLNNINEYKKMAKAINPYGDGYASEKILELCLKFLKNKN